MTPDQVLVGHLNGALQALVLVGLAVNRRSAMCRLFTLFVAGSFVSNRLIMHWPDQFYVWWFWVLQKAVSTALMMGAAVELGALVFRELPRARRVCLVALAAAITAGAVSMLLPHERGSVYTVTLGILIPRAQATTVAAFALIGVLAAYHRAPLHQYHRALLLSFIVYLALDVGALGLIREFGWVAYHWTDVGDRLLYGITASVWVWAAWRRSPALSPTMQRLQPWAVP